MIIFIALSAFVSTFLGGFFALKFKDKLHLILGFSAGAVIGVAFFDLLPESVNLGEKFYEPDVIAMFVATGFLAYLVLDRVIFFHSHAGEHSHENSEEKGRGILGAASLSVHSFFDGVVVGLAFQVSSAVGVIVAVAVLVHDFSDGINTVNLILKNNGGKRSAFRWLIVDAFAPVAGIASTFFFTLPEQSLSIVLALFCGFFLYIGASDLLPESHHAHPKMLTTIMTFIGVAVMYGAIKFAGM